MDPELSRFFNQVRRSVTSVVKSLTEAFNRLKQPGNDYRSQRMCPFCGLITPRSKRLCQECGKSLKALQVDRKDAPQG
jgi:rRNA maturation endonuclease Nob1